MNHRRALRLSTDAGLAIFFIMIIGVVLWTTDEVLGWDLLPDWIDQFARLLVILFAILAGFAVVVSLMCAISVIAESMAEKEGLQRPAPLGKLWSVVGVGLLVAFGGMFGLHKFDQFRTQKRVDQRAGDLEERMPETVALFSPEVKEALTADRDEAGDREVARLLNAIEQSLPHRPNLRVIVPADAPYTHCVLSAYPEPRRGREEGEWEYLDRRFLTGFPSEWEGDAVVAGLGGSEMSVPRAKRGVFLDSTAPASVVPIGGDGGAVVGLLSVRGSL